MPPLTDTPRLRPVTAPVFFVASSLSAKDVPSQRPSNGIVTLTGEAPPTASDKDG